MDLNPSEKLTKPQLTLEGDTYGEVFVCKNKICHSQFHMQMLCRLLRKQNDKRRVKLIARIILCHKKVELVYHRPVGYS